ncbi:MAG: hypothetical protein ACRDZ4_22225 [Egibacteraceae bacterium]
MTPPSGPAQGAGSWPEEILNKELANPGLALSVLNLHLYSYKWIHHRLHQVVFWDETTVRQTFTVDFTIPTHVPTISVHGIKEVRLLPIDLLQKQNLVISDIHDQAGNLLSYFTRSQLGIIATTMLVKYAEGLLDEPLPHDVVQSLQELVTSYAEGIEEAKNNWHSKTFDGPEAQHAHDIKSRLISRPEFAFVCQRLTDSFILLVPTEATPGSRLKISYCLDLPLKNYIKDPRTRWRRLFEQLGWRETSIDFPLEAAADTQSYDFEIEDPPGVDLYQAAIIEHRAPQNEMPQSPILHDWQPGGVTKLNLHARGVERSSVIVAHVDVEDSSEFWLRAFMITSFALALLLLMGAWRLPYLLDPQAQNTGINEVAAALLLFLAGVIATVVVISDPRGLLRKLLYRLRQLATVTPAIPIVAVAFLLFSPSGFVLRWTWFCLGLTALLAGVLSTFSYLLPKPPQRPPKYRQKTEEVV